MKKAILTSVLALIAVGLLPSCGTVKKEEIKVNVQEASKSSEAIETKASIEKQDQEVVKTQDQTDRGSEGASQAAEENKL